MYLRAMIRFNHPPKHARIDITRHTLENASGARKAKKIPVQQQKHIKFIEETQTLLTLTTCLPFKVKSWRFRCAYCIGRGFTLFEDVHALKKHTESHGQECITKMERILQPMWLNEMLRVDMTDLKCKACFEIIPSWNDMFQHFHDKHDIDFDQAYTRVIPFKLDTELRCALCNELFQNLLLLDVHMNSHYSNYVCPECGATFLTESRLKKHVQIHESKKFPCDECGKVFTLNKYRAKHISMFHKKEKVFKCLYCAESFTSDHTKQNHIVAKHPEKAKTVTCEVCARIFNGRHSYLSHCRKKHDEKRFKCKLCPKVFRTNYDYKIHYKRHIGERPISCSECDKTFVTPVELRSHSRVHNKDGN